MKLDLLTENDHIFSNPKEFPIKMVSHLRYDPKETAGYQLCVIKNHKCDQKIIHLMFVIIYTINVTISSNFQILQFSMTNKLYQIKQIVNSILFTK